MRQDLFLGPGLSDGGYTLYGWISPSHDSYLYVAGGADEYKLYPARLDTVPAVAAGPTNYTLNCDVGTYAITGQASQLLLARLLNTEAGSYTISGITSALLVARMIAASPGTYAITGPDAQLLADRLIGLVPGSYIIGGSDPQVTATRVLDLAAGAYAISGAAGGLLSARIITAEAGVYTISGVEVDLDYTSTGPVKNIFISNKSKWF